MNRIVLVLMLLAGVCLGQTAKKSVVLQVDTYANGKTGPGDTLRYTILVSNSSASAITNVVLTGRASTQDLSRDVNGIALAKQNEEILQRMRELESGLQAVLQAR